MKSDTINTPQPALSDYGDCHSYFRHHHRSRTSWKDKRFHEKTLKISPIITPQRSLRSRLGRVLAHPPCHAAPVHWCSPRCSHWCSVAASARGGAWRQSLRHAAALPPTRLVRLPLVLPGSARGGAWRQSLQHAAALPPSRLPCAPLLRLGVGPWLARCAIQPRLRPLRLLGAP